MALEGEYKMKKGMAILLVAALLITGTAVFSAAEETNLLSEQIEDSLNASI